MKNRWCHIAVILSVLTLAACNEDSKEPIVPVNPEDCELVSFSIPKDSNGLDENISFAKSDADKTLTATYLKWIEKSDPDMFVPTFTIKGAKLTADGKELISGKTKISFAKDFKLTVEAQNGSKKTYTVSLICPQINGELPLMRLFLNASDITSKEKYVSTKMDLSSPFTKLGWWSSTKNEKIGIRGRGNSTWSLPKKPYRIKFPEKYSPIGMEHAEDKSWVILAHDMDKSLLRNHLAFALSRVLFDSSDGFHDKNAVLFTPASTFVNVYMNKSYHGIYQMTDQMEKGKGRIDVETLGAAEGTSPDVISGGHIVETSVHSGSSPVRFKSSKGINMDHKYPDDEDFLPAQYSYIEKYIKEAESALYGSNFKDPKNGWRKYFDERTLADYIIVKEFAADMDGYISTYLYKKRGIDKIFFGPVWDCDKGWGNEKRGSSDKINRLMIDVAFGMPGCSGDHWYKQFWKDAEFRKLVNERWKSKRNELLIAVLDELDNKPVQMAKSIKANYKVWKFNEQKCSDAPLPAETYELEIERIREYTYNRMDALDKLFAK